jgi:molybdenum cofactor biosynthesis enzyme MoaA
MAGEAPRVEIGVIGVPPTSVQLAPRDLPETVLINLTKLCNLWCTHCYYPEVTRERERSQGAGGPRPTLFLPVEIFRGVADEMAMWTPPAVLRVLADGEPLIHPKAVEMIAYAKARGVPVALTTNGTPLTPRVVARLLDSAIDVIDVSIDAATAETFGKVRGTRTGANYYHLVERNVRGLIEARNALTPPPPTRVIVNMIDQPLAHGEVDEFIAKWKGAGADVVLIRPFHSTSGQTLQVGVATARPAVGRFPCKYPFTRLNVGFDEHGHPVVYYCSHDWTEKSVVGVLGKDGTLRDIWDGPQMAEIRRRHLANAFPAGSFCGPCPDWYLGWGKSHQGLVTDPKTSAPT